MNGIGVEAHRGAFFSVFGRPMGVVAVLVGMRASIGIRIRLAATEAPRPLPPVDTHEHGEAFGERAIDSKGDLAILVAI